MDVLSTFLIVGQLQLAAFKSTYIVLNSPPTRWPAWGLTEPGHSYMPLFFTVSGVSFLFTMAYGFVHLTWWIPLFALIIGFPFTHHLILRRLLPDTFMMVTGTLCSLGCSLWIALKWFAWSN
jgi:hypothetical protein